MVVIFACDLDNLEEKIINYHDNEIENQNFKKIPRGFGRISVGKKKFFSKQIDERKGWKKKRKKKKIH